MKRAFVVISFVMIAALAACTLAPRNTGSAYMFALSPVRAAAQGEGDKRLDVAFPAAGPELDTARIAILRNRKTWDYYAGAKWSDFLPELVQHNVVSTLESSHLFKSVDPDAGPLADDILKLEIRAFHAEYLPGREAPVVHIGIKGILLDRLEQKPLANIEVVASRNAADDSFPAIRSAFQSAFASAQKQLVERLSASPR